MTPEPRLRSWRSLGASKRRNSSSPKNRRKNGSSNGAAPCPSVRRLVRVVEIFTTEGVTAFATSTKFRSDPPGPLNGGRTAGTGGVTASRTACPVGSQPRSAAMTRPSSTPRPISNRPRKMELRECAGINPGDRSEELQGVLFFPLERVAADDRSKASAVTNGPDFIKDGLVILLGRAARKYHDAPSIERRLDDMMYSF